MSVAIGILLALGVASAWLGTLAFLRLSTSLERVHVVTFVNFAAGAPITLASFLADGLSSRSLKVALIWLATLIFGALLSQVTGRAIHLRSGERR